MTILDPPPQPDTLPLAVDTLGGFRVWRNGAPLNAAAWQREKALHLFQYLITTRRLGPRHKESIILNLWPHLSGNEGDRDFKVALNAINKVLEPERKPRAPARFVQRFDLAYGLNLPDIQIDADIFEAQISAAHRALPTDPETAIQQYHRAVALYRGDYLPERRYEDWCSPERERLQVLALGAMTALADLLLEETPLESIRLTQHALELDPLWENAYRTQMRAHMALGNRPLAVRAYRQCEQTLERELGIPPLPETEALYRQITGPSPRL